MNKFVRSIVLAVVLLFVANDFAHTQGTAPSKITELAVVKTPIPVRVLVRSPAETNTELQIICLFQSDAKNALHGSLAEIDGKLKGLLDRIRKPTLFRGDLGETMLITSPAGTLKAKRLLIVGLGDSETFTPARLELVGSIVYNESTRLGVAHPFFAPTILDGGMTRFSTGETAENFVKGFARAMRTQKNLESAGAAPAKVVANLTFLAGPTHASDTQEGLKKALAAAEF